MPVTSNWQETNTPGFDSQQQYLQVSQGGFASLSSSTTVYNSYNLQAEGCPPNQFNTLDTQLQQNQHVQPSFHDTQPQTMLTTTQNPELLSQDIPWDGQYYEQHNLSSTEVPALQQPGAESLVKYQHQEPSSMAGMYYGPQQQVVYGGQLPSLPVQNIESQQQIKQLTPLVYNLPQQSSGLCNWKGQTLAPNPLHPQSVLNTLIGHEPCIHTLNYLEAQIESQKQIGNSQVEQIKVLLEQTAHQKEELKRLKQECSLKDTTIETLRTQIDDAQKGEVPGLLAVIKEQREELEKFQKRSRNGQGNGRRKVGGDVYPHKRPLDCQLGDQNHENNLADMVSRLNLNQCELRRLQEENQTFRLDIGRLERENSELSRLRVDVIELKRRLKEARPLEKAYVASDQSVSSTALSERIGLLTHTCDHVSYARTK